MEEKRKSYRPEIRDERVEKLVRLDCLCRGDVFIMCDDPYMVLGDEIDYWREAISDFKLVPIVNLTDGNWSCVDGRDLVLPVKATITIN